MLAKWFVFSSMLSHLLVGIIAFFPFLVGGVYSLGCRAHMQKIDTRGPTLDGPERQSRLNRSQM
jgi:hypothetical protein